MTTAASAVGSNSAPASSSGPNTPLGRDVFLQLLVTQLRNQDPMNPVDDKEFIAQLAQFSSLETMQTMSSSMDQMGLTVNDINATVVSSIRNNASFAALNLIGKQVEVVDPDDSNKTIKGTVSGVKFTDDGPVLTVGDNEITLNQIKSVYQ